MSQQTKIMGRREFIASSFAALAGSAFVASAIGGADETQAQAKQIPTRLFGKTGRALPILGMGSSPIVACWATGYGTKLRSIEGDQLQRTALRSAPPRRDSLRCRASHCRLHDKSKVRDFANGALKQADFTDNDLNN